MVRNFGWGWFRGQVMAGLLPGPQLQGAWSAVMCDKSHCAEIAHVSSKNHKAMVERTAQLAIQVTHPHARLRSKGKE